jgi:hypothetical protein
VLFANFSTKVFKGYYYGEQIKMLVAGRSVEFIGKMRNVYQILVGKPEGKKLLGKPRCR